MAYSKAFREMALALYADGKSSYVIAETLLGPNASTIQAWAKEMGLSRTDSEAARTRTSHRESVKQSPDVKKQHYRARKEFPAPLGICELCGERPAIDRMRIDHTLFPYDPAFVVLGCRQCNRKHDHNEISIVFFNPFDGNWYCASKVVRGGAGISGETEITRIVDIWDTVGQGPTDMELLRMELDERAKGKG